MRIGGIMRKWRLVQERSVREVASEIGISPATYSRIERGEGMDAETFMKLLDWLAAKPVEPEPAAQPVQERLLGVSSE